MLSKIDFLFSWYIFQVIERIRKGLRPEELLSLGKMLGRAEILRDNLHEDAAKSDDPLVKKKAQEVGDGWVRAVRQEIFEPSS